MAKREGLLLGLLSDFIRRNPKTSASIAFNLGVYAGATMRRSLLRHDVTLLPDKIVQLVPSMKDITAYVPLLDTSKRKSSRSRVRKPASKLAIKKVGRNSRKR